VEEVGIKTNNQAEYLALIKALMSGQAVSAVIYTDSQLLVGHLTKNWNVRDPKLKALWKEAEDWLRKTGAKLEWVPRAKNRAGKLLESR
jgi:ribonuclease HI